MGEAPNHPTWTSFHSLESQFVETFAGRLLDQEILQAGPGSTSDADVDLGLASGREVDNWFAFYLFHPMFDKRPEISFSRKQRTVVSYIRIVGTHFKLGEFSVNVKGVGEVQPFLEFKKRFSPEWMTIWAGRNGDRSAFAEAWRPKHSLEALAGLYICLSRSAKEGDSKVPGALFEGDPVRRY